LGGASPGELGTFLENGSGSIDNSFDMDAELAALAKVVTIPPTPEKAKEPSLLMTVSRANRSDNLSFDGVNGAEGMYGRGVMPDYMPTQTPSPAKGTDERPSVKQQWAYEFESQVIGGCCV
jgi:hypothetical protein